MDALDAYEAKVRRRHERRSRALARAGKKRQEQRRRDASEERRAEACANEAMAFEDAASVAWNCALEAQAKQRAHDAAIASFREATRLRKRLQTYHLDVHTGSADSTASRIDELQRRVTAHDARLASAAVAQARLATVAQHHAAKRTEIALASSGVWTQKMAAALREANCDAFEHLIAHGADPDSEAHGVTPLICAIATNHLAVARAVLALGADPGFETSDGKTALLVAIVADDLHALALLPPTCFAHATKFGATGMLVACEKGRVAVVERLLALSPDLVNAPNALGLTPLMVAAKHNFLSLIRVLLTCGATPTLQARNGDTAATLAHAAGFLGAAALCSSSCALDAKREAKDMAATELGLARALDAAPIPSIFAYLRAHTTASPRYESPVGDMLLHVCCARGTSNDVRAALSLCPWFLPNRFGLTGAMIAAQNGRLDALHELVAAGADLNQPDFLGRDCFYHLHAHGHDQLAANLGKLEDATQQLETLFSSIRTDVDDDVAFLGHIYLEHARVLAVAARNETVVAIQRFEQALALLWTHVAMDDSHLCVGLDDYHRFLVHQLVHNLAQKTLQRRLGRLPATHALVQQAVDKLDDAIGARERAAMRQEDKAAPSRAMLLLVLRSDDRFRAFCARRGKDAHVDLWRAIDALDPTERSRPIGFALYSQFVTTKKVLCLPSKVQLRLLAHVDHSVAAADGSRRDKPLVSVFAKTKRILFEYLYSTAYMAYAATTTRTTTP
ncbi:hypothetical protein, variant [Saprolegnia diclina VS20]|uniref:Uncharacterized protein n=1 Tax=Saprolegnia diclina (strain VS20) TaxID=1156394 RepID=T0QCT5_SAPDV|nr:hypothetical protein, variant [Saprolegnia diclina VS20]EQC35714.1 hypothetical protein, variant [Saprolegnia diclina VS20]|eukprot:XP_008611031.1 hypothetical protein, variant [Saprolegnia diclina VS20]